MSIPRTLFFMLAWAWLALLWLGQSSALAKMQNVNLKREVELAPGFLVLNGAVNTGLLVFEGQALLIDCCDSVTPERLARLGVQRVEMILCTQHRSSHVAGAYAYLGQGAQIVAPETERSLFEGVADYWADPKHRWHLYDQQPGPEVLATPVPVTRGVRGGDIVEWRGAVIRVLDTPGATDGSVSYALERGGKQWVFSGDVLFGPGQLWDLYSLQKGFGEVGDYHGFLGNRTKLLASLDTLAKSGATLLPAHGQPIPDPASAAELLKQRLDALWRNYVATSALNHYFPKLFEDLKEDALRMKPAQTAEFPAWVQPVAATSFAVVSDSGAALLIDCGQDSVIKTLDEWLKAGKIRQVEGCWVTHYHDDHVDALDQFVKTFGAPIMCDASMAEILEHPDRFYLPCISPCRAPVARATQDAESWSWQEFKLTAYHLPGQTLYHGGLLVEGHGKKVFFAGDSGAPTGIDDYTAGNRTFLALGRGFRRCVEIWRECRPDYILNQHQKRAFIFTDQELDYIDRMLAERERLIGEMVPWPNANFGLDPWWVRTYPYEQSAQPGSVITVDVQFTNHDGEPARARVEPVLPEGWTWNPEKSQTGFKVLGRTCGLVDPRRADTDPAVRMSIRIPENAAAGRYIIPCRVTWNGQYLGQFRHAVVSL